MTIVYELRRTFIKKVLSLVLSCAIIAVAAPVLAQQSDFGDETTALGLLTDMLWPGKPQIELGLGSDYSPDYLGSDDYEVDVLPKFSAKFGDKVVADNSGISVGLFRINNFTLGPVLSLSAGRKESKNAALVGLGNVGRAVELGAVASAQINGRYSFKLRFRRAIKTGHRGGTADAEAAIRLFDTGTWRGAASIKGTWSGENYAESFFSVTPEQAMTSGLPVFNASRGIRDIRGNFVLRWNFKDNWAVNGFARYDRLFGDAAQTPIVADFGSRNQFAVGWYLSYTFGLF